MPVPLLFLAALAQAAPPEVRVLGPGKPNAQTLATMMVEPPAMFIVGCDSDRDGRTTRIELDECVARSFAAIDTGRTGKLGYIAYADWQKRWLGDQGALPSPLEVDRNGDDQVTADELQGQFARLFARFDKDKDGAVTRAEALTIRSTPADGRGPAQGPRRGRAGPPPSPRDPAPTGTTTGGVPDEDR